MPPPVTTISLNAVDITDDVHAPEGDWTLRYGRGANFDGSSEAPGYAVIRVLNNTKKFSPYNSGSAIASSLKFGKRVHISTVYSAVTYHPFDGYLDRIVQDPYSGFAELHCIDLLGLARRRETPLVLSGSRDLRAFRGLILDGLGLAAGDRSMGTGTGEGALPYTGADRDPASDWLTEINAASGSIHFVRGKSGSQEYVAIDRTQLQSAAVAETWSDTDFSQPFAEVLGGLDYTQEGLINRMLVAADEQQVDLTPVEIWRSPEVYAPGAGVSRVIWAEGFAPSLDITATYTATGNATVTPQPYRASVRITLAGGAAGGTVSNLVLTGRPVRSYDYAVEPVAEEQDATSQTTYGGVITASLASELIPNLAHAHGLASWYIYRYKDVRARPPVTMVNRLPSQLTRDIGDRVAVTSAELSTSASQFWIRALETTVSEHGAVWRTDYDLEAAPALVDIVTVGGTSAQGVGGTAILGY